MNKAHRITIAVQEIRLRHSTQMGPIYFHGETMRPFLGEGDRVVVEPVEWHDIRLGDIITYRFEDKFPTRRVIAIDRRAETVVVHGDNVRGFPNERVGRQDVLGRAQARIRNGSHLDRRSPEWRRAARRAVAAQTCSRLAHTTPWPARGLFFRMARYLTAR